MSVRLAVATVVGLLLIVPPARADINSATDEPPSSFANLVFPLTIDRMEPPQASPEITVLVNADDLSEPRTSSGGGGLLLAVGLTTFAVIAFIATRAIDLLFKSPGHSRRRRVRLD